jgi:hypothetical protein
MSHAINGILVAGGVMLASWAWSSAADDSRRSRAASDADALAEITLRVPAADVRIWDPMNPNVNPIPWRVYGPAGNEDDRTAQFRHQAIGEVIVVEGIAWGYVHEPGTPHSGVPTSRVLFEGGVLLAKGADFNQPDIHGRLVRIEGTLQREAIPGHPGFKRQFPEYYFVDVTDFALIEAVTDPHVAQQYASE